MKSQPYNAIMETGPTENCARLKYTLDKYGVEWFVKELETRTGFSLEPAKAFCNYQP
jgi:sulfite reductase beta subunit-like hemoprotein